MTRSFNEAFIDQLTVNNILGPGAPRPVSAGQKFYVMSAPAVGGRYPETPFTTIAAALASCVASRGDTIYVCEGHAETLTLALMVNKIGVTIIGLGNGTNRPAITVNGTIPGFNMTAANVKVYNMRIISGSSVAVTTRLTRIAASNVKFIGCQFESAYRLYHQHVIFSGDRDAYEDCVFISTYSQVAGTAGIKAQTCVLNIGGTNARVFGCRFNDMGGDKANRWKACVEGGKLTASLEVEKCFFMCRGIATRTRSAAASGLMSTIDCRAISPSSNTSSGALYTPTYQYVIESYDVAAVNKVSTIAVTTSDIRMKTGVVYL